MFIIENRDRDTSTTQVSISETKNINECEIFFGHK